MQLSPSHTHLVKDQSLRIAGAVPTKLFILSGESVAGFGGPWKIHPIDVLLNRNAPCRISDGNFCCSKSFGRQTAPNNLRFTHGVGYRHFLESTSIISRLLLVPGMSLPEPGMHQSQQGTKASLSACAEFQRDHAYFVGPRSLSSRNPVSE